MRSIRGHFALVVASAVGLVFFASCGNGDGSTRTQGDVQSLASHLIFTVVHDGHDGLTDEHDEFLDELIAAHDNLSDEHQTLVGSFHDDEIASRGWTDAHFLHELYYNPNSPEILEIVTDPKYLDVEAAVHAELGVLFDEEEALRGVEGAASNVAVVAAPLVSCTIATVIIVAIVAGVVGGAIAAGTIITLALINSAGAQDFCQKCGVSAENNCDNGTSMYRCDTSGVAETETSGETEKEKNTYKTHDTNNTAWVCSYQCN